MFESMKVGMSSTRQRFRERMNVLLDRGPSVDEEFWDGLEEALIFADVGAQSANDIIVNMRELATRKALPDAYAVLDALAEIIAEMFEEPEENLFDQDPVLVLFVGINGAGKTTTVGKIAAEQKAKGREVLIGSADTFRAAAIEQLEVWAQRANVEIVERERGSDPASVCYDTIERGEAAGSNMILIDTAGRLHTSDDLMRELQKVVNVVRKRSNMPVRIVLVIDATTGQNGLSQARQFNDALDLDAVIVTKLDGTAKGGIALAVSHELGLPVAKVGVGESLEDLQDFDAFDFSAALIGAEPQYVLVAADGTERVVTKEEFERVTSAARQAQAQQAGEAQPEPEQVVEAEQAAEPEEAVESDDGRIDEPDVQDDAVAEEDFEEEGVEEEDVEDAEDAEEDGEGFDGEEEADDGMVDDAAQAEDEAEYAEYAEDAEEAEEDFEDDADEDAEDLEDEDEEDAGEDLDDESAEADEQGEGEADDEADDKADEAADDADKADEAAEQEEPKKEGRMKRLFKWMRS